MKRSYPFKSFLIIFGFSAAAVTGLLVIALIRARPMIYQAAVSNAESLSLRLTDNAVAQVLKSEGISYDRIITVSCGDDGTVKALNVNTKEINLLKTEISSKASQLISETPECPVVLPVGTVIGGEYINGLGPSLRFPMQITATAYVDFKSNFKGTGINQVLHQILIEIRVEGVVLSVVSRYPFSTVTSAIAAQSVIVGDVPGAYTNVIEQAGSDIADDIFNYAELEID